MRASSLLTTALLLLTGCSFDFGSFQGGSGGAAGSSGNAGPAGTAGTAGTSGTTGSAGTAGTSSSGNASTGSSMSDLGPCGGLTDTFDSFDGSKWTKVGTVDEQMKMLHETFSDGTPFTEARTKAGAHFEECYATIKVVTYPPETTVYLAVEEQKMGGGSQEIAYDAKGSDVFTPNFNDQLSADPRYLGIAFHAGQIYFLHNTNGAWTVVSSNARPAFLDDGPNDVIAIGLEKGSDGDEAFFDDYDVVPIHVADL